MRLAQQIGYAGWPELKSAFASDLWLHGKGYEGRGRTQDLASELFATQCANLDATQTASSSHCGAAAASFSMVTRTSATRWRLRRRSQCSR